MKFDLLEITDPGFVKKLTIKEREELATEIRKFIIDSVSRNGGHLSSNLGIIELTIALHYHFSVPTDKVFFDVGHQSYCHKILTGRAAKFDSLRKLGGISGFQKFCESEYDCFEAGHTSTSISAAVGMAIARDLSKEKYFVVPVIGDAAIMSGMSLEALNHLGTLNNKVIIILNDNGMGISKSIGALSHLLSGARSDWRYLKTKQGIKSFLKKIPLLGHLIFYIFNFFQKIIRRIFVKENVFNNFGLGYIGLVNGHNFKKLDKALKNAKRYPKSIVVHVKTKKGKGYRYSETDEAGEWHGVAPFYKYNGEAKNDSKATWSASFAEILLNKMREDNRLIAITPAMIIGSELTSVFNEFPERSIDVGIAEEHAVTLAAGLALSGKRPIVIIYSSFLQRAYDQIVHDVVRMNLPVLFVIDRAGFVGADGETHHGIFDSSFLNDFPEVIICMARNNSELFHLTNLALNHNGPFFIRMPRSKEVVSEQSEFQIGEWEKIVDIPVCKGYLISYGPVINKLIDIAAEKELTLINARFTKPIDKKMLSSLENKLPIFIYDIYSTYNALCTSIHKYYANAITKIYELSLPNKFVNHGGIEELLAKENVAIKDLVKMIDGVLK